MEVFLEYSLGIKRIAIAALAASSLAGCDNDDVDTGLPYDIDTTVVISPDGTLEEVPTPDGADCIDVGVECATPQVTCGSDDARADLVIDGEGNVIEIVCYPIEDADRSALPEDELPMARALRGARMDAQELVVVRPDGGVSQVEAYATPLSAPSDPEPRAVLGIYVTLRHRQGTLTLTVADDGVGFPSGFPAASSNSLGMRIIGLLTHQLRGEISFTRSPSAEPRNEASLRAPVESRVASSDEPRA